ncbi:hypothetical protein EDB84DRAFT_662308 [Lactarius hengduanensis]|nr:hypothetical protein EDB84DRAFT_662308 [Lactarius hengduanensis]
MTQPSESEDHCGLPEGRVPLLYRHAAIGTLPSVNTLDSDLASLSPGTTGDNQEILLRRRAFNFPLLDRNTSIEVLPDDVLLNIFGSYRVSSPLHWHRLTHVCRRWRRIVFASPRGLDLRLYCKHGTPVLKTLDYWPALPIAVQYKGCPMLNPPTPEDEDNIVAALKRSDRVCSISLTVTHSLLKKLGTIEEPFPELEDLVLLCRNGLPLPFPSNFRWGTRLRSLCLTRISFPTLPHLLSSCPNLVDLQLHEIFNFQSLSPQAIANALSGVTQLQSLSLHFHFPVFHPSLIAVPPLSGERLVLPALTHFKFRGTSDYLNGFVAGIDAPHLADIEITFSHWPTIDVSPLRQFIDRIEMQKCPRRADVLFSECAISMSLTRPRAPARLELRISCRQLNRQLSSMARIRNHFSQSLDSVKDLRIEVTRTSSGQDSTNGERWTEFLRSFRGAERLHVAGELATDILHALRPAAGEPTNDALPALTNLYVIGPRSGALQDAVRSIITPRKLSGSPIVGKYINADSRKDKTLPEPTAEDDESARKLPTRTRTCRYCNLRFEERQDLIRQSRHRAPSEECEEWCRLCCSPWSQCLFASRRRLPRYRPPNVWPSNALPSDNSSSAIDRVVMWLGNSVPSHPTVPLYPPRLEVPTTSSHISETRSTRRPTKSQRVYQRFIPSLRSLGNLLSSRLRRWTEAAESSNDQLEPVDQALDVWSVIENEMMV